MRQDGPRLVLPGDSSGDDGRGVFREPATRAPRQRRKALESRRGGGFHGCRVFKVSGSWPPAIGSTYLVAVYPML